MFNAAPALLSLTFLETGFIPALSRVSTYRVNRAQIQTTDFEEYSSYQPTS
jgi:hypothetical protein